MWFKLIFVTVCFKIVLSDYERPHQCNTLKRLMFEINNYKTIVNKIIQEATEGESKGFVYNELQQFVDKFGSRLAGSSNLEKSIDHMLYKLKKLGLDNVHGEAVTLQKWVRGNESATLISPRQQKLEMLGLGSSVGTTPDGITAEAIVVRSFKELSSAKKKVKGKIVVFNEDWVSYHETVKYRSRAATKAAGYGAVAALVKSVTSFSLNTPHTGWQYYSNKVPKIPVACITVEDAHMLYRMYQTQQKVVINVKMEAKTLNNKISRNTVADIKGSKYPKRVVIVSGHLDSWDVGQGVVDDGGGAFISWSVLVLLNKLKLVPRRTIRTVLWTGEEFGLIGASAYAKQHHNESDNFNLLMESDEGTFNPLGLEFNGSNEAYCILKEILKLLKPINATQIKRKNSVGSDITVWSRQGIPSASLLNENEKYYWYHHTAGDTMDVLNSRILDKCLAVWAAVAYVVADISVNLPRD